VTSIVLGFHAIFIFLFFPEPSFTRTGPGEQSVGSEYQEKTDKSNIPAVESQQTIQSHRKTFLQELKPWSKINREQNFILLFFKPFPLILYPATVFTILALAVSLAWFLAILSVNSSVFQAPPYNMTPSINSLINISGVIGNVLGSYLGGALTDKYIEWQARRNGGIYEPEMRLVGLILPLITTPAGLVM
jgi:hypothetical protein